MSKTAEEWVDELHHGVTVYAKDIANKRNVEIIRRIQNEALEMAAKWYAETGWMIDEYDVPDAIRALKEPT